MEGEMWDDGDIQVMVQSSVDPGRSFGRGRGFRPLQKSTIYDNDPGNVSSVIDNLRDDDVPGFAKNNEKSSGFNERGGANFVRGRGGGRGRSGGRGGFSDDTGGSNRQRSYDENTNARVNSGGGFSSHKAGECENSDDPPKPRELYIPPEPVDDEAAMFDGGISCGINFDKYDNIKVEVTGENVPQPAETFQSAGLCQFVLDNVKKSGYLKPTPVQKHALPIIMSGRDLMACAQTGSGKTAAFLLPMINTLIRDTKDLIITSQHCEPHAIIISPTRELAVQIYTEARKFSHGSIVKVVVAYGGTAVYHQVRQVMDGCHILVATPGRLIDFVNRGRITFSSIRFLVLDEADRMLDMGFMPDVERIMNHSTMVPNGERQTLMFSATFPVDIQRLAGKFLHGYLFLAIGIVGGACSDVEQRFHMVSKFEKRPKLVDLLSQEGSEKTLVFVEMKRTADFIAAYLSDNDFPTTSIHGDRMQQQREEALWDFKSGRMGVLVATAVAARGLDIKNVSHVVNFDLPKSIDEYVHRIGRTGRVGNCGKATSFYDPECDGPLAKDLLKILQQAGQNIPPWLEKYAADSLYSSQTHFGRFGGKDFRKFDKNGEPDSFLGGVSDSGRGQPQPLEPEEDW